mgnify:CR=1 FL=1
MDILERINRAITTASNDDLSQIGADKRTRHVERIDTMQAAYAEIERLLAQLPDGMKHCTIGFKECAVGHGRLTATNWIDRGCPHCENERLLAALRKIEKRTRDPVARSIAGEILVVVGDEQSAATEEKP